MKTNIFIQVVLMLHILFFANCGNTSLKTQTVQTIELEFDRALSNEEQKTVLEVIKQRLKSGNISFSTIESAKNRVFTIGIKKEDEKDKALKLLQPQGLFSINEVFPKEDITNDLIAVDDMLRFEFGLESTILNFVILIEPQNEDMSFEEARSVLGLCNPSDTQVVNTLLNHLGVKDILPNNVVFKWLQEQHQGRLQLVALIFNNNESQISQKDIASIAIEENIYGKLSLIINFNSTGAKNLQKVTERNRDMALAIVFDDVVQGLLAAASINNGRIEVNELSRDELDIFSNILSVGQPYPAKISKSKIL